MEQKQIIRNYLLDTTKENYSLNKLIDNKIAFSESLEGYSITNTSMTTLIDGKILLLVVFTKD